MSSVVAAGGVTGRGLGIAGGAALAGWLELGLDHDGDGDQGTVPLLPADAAMYHGARAHPIRRSSPVRTEPPA